LFYQTYLRILGVNIKKLTHDFIPILLSQQYCSLSYVMADDKLAVPFLPALL
jgi:hypothetical protein